VARRMEIGARGVAGYSDGAVAGLEGDGAEEVVVEEGGGGDAGEDVEAVGEGDGGPEETDALDMVEGGCGGEVGEEEEEEEEGEAGEGEHVRGG